MALFGKKCFACRKKIGKDEVPKYHRTAAGSHECFCKKCSNAMGGTGMKNQVNRKDKKDKDKGPNTGKYFA